jgi:phage antirepressor YoqD-like protein
VLQQCARHIFTIARIKRYKVVATGSHTLILRVTNYMKMQDTYTYAAHNQFATAVNMANEPSFMLPNALYNVLKLAADLEGEREALTGLVKVLEWQIDVDAVKVEFYNDMADTEELFNTGVVAKTFGTSKPKLLNYLRKYKILMGSGHKRNLPYQQHMDAGRLEAAWVNCVDRKTGKRKITPVPLFTGKGIIWIQQFIKQNGRQGL